MTDKELFVKTIADEAPRFEKVFKALPQDKLDYRPDPKSRNAKDLVETMAAESLMFAVFLKSGELDFSATPPPPATNIDNFLALMKKGLNETGEVAGNMTQEDWDSESKMMSGGKEEWKTTKGQMAWGLLLDLIHHRGQLSTYIRPMGGKVPSIYGPSGDTNG